MVPAVFLMTYTFSGGDTACSDIEEVMPAGATECLFVPFCLMKYLYVVLCILMLMTITEATPTILHYSIEYK